MYEKCKSCFYNEAMDVCIRCFNYSSYRSNKRKPTFSEIIETRYGTRRPENLWPKENPYLKHVWEVGDDIGTEDLSDKFIKEIKEKENMKDFRIVEVTEHYTNEGYEYVINANSTTPIIRNLGEDIETTNRIVKNMIKSYYGIAEKKPTYARPIPTIKDVRFNGPATIVFWEDGTKTVVKARDENVDYEKGLAMAIAKKALGNKGAYFNEFKKWIPEEAENVEEPKTIGKVVSSLMDAQGATFECQIDDVNTFKQLITTTDDGKVFNISFEGVVKEKD